MKDQENSENFIKQAGSKRSGIVREFYGFLLHNKKFWLLPIIIVVLTLGLLVILGGSSAAPFIYTLF